MRDSTLVLEAIRLAGGKATKLCKNQHFGMSSVSDWRHGRRPIPRNERKRLEEFVQHQGAGLSDEYRVLIERARKHAPDLIAKTWDPQFEAIMKRAHADIAVIMARVNQETEDLFKVVTKLERAQAAAVKKAAKVAQLVSDGRRSA